VAWLERNQLLVLSLALLLLLGGLLVRDLAGGSPPALVLREAQAGNGSVVVHVAGAIAAPGVYELPAGARVRDAIEAAGGAIVPAATGELNLARRLRDGERIEVSGEASEVAAAVATMEPGEKLDINSATMEQLDRLPGIGEAYSRRIVDSRLVDGPYQAVDDLVTRRVIPASTLDEIRDMVSVGAP